MAFFRVQYEQSFTEFNTTGFIARGRSHMAHIHWLTRLKIERHLDWSDRCRQPTPFISVYDNYNDAQQRANFLKRRGYVNVKIAEISIPLPRNNTIKIVQRRDTIYLPVVEHVDRDGDITAFFSVRDARRHLGVRGWAGQDGEWLAIQTIPSTIIVNMDELLE